MTPEAFDNALTVDMALGCSTNTVLHLTAIAHEAGVALDLNMINEISERTPHICSLSPGGAHHIEDLDRAGGIGAVINELSAAGLIHADNLTVTGKTIADNTAGVRPVTPRSYARWTVPTTRRAAWPYFTATWHPTDAWSSNPPFSTKCCSTKDRRGSLIPKKRPLKPSWRAGSTRAM